MRPPQRCPLGLTGIRCRMSAGFFPSTCLFAKDSLKETSSGVAGRRFTCSIAFWTAPATFDDLSFICSCRSVSIAAFFVEDRDIGHVLYRPDRLDAAEQAQCMFQVFTSSNLALLVAYEAAREPLAAVRVPAAMHVGLSTRVRCFSVERERDALFRQRTLPSRGLRPNDRRKHRVRDIDHRVFSRPQRVANLLPNAHSAAFLTAAAAQSAATSLGVPSFMSRPVSSRISSMSAMQSPQCHAKCSPWSVISWVASALHEGVSHGRTTRISRSSMPARRQRPPSPRTHTRW